MPAPGVSHCMSTVKTAWSGTGVSRTTNGVLALRTANVAATRVSEDKSACAVVVQYIASRACVRSCAWVAPLPLPLSHHNLQYASFTTKHHLTITQSQSHVHVHVYAP